MRRTSVSLRYPGLSNVFVKLSFSLTLNICDSTEPSVSYFEM